MVVFPVGVTLFFTTMLDEGVPQDMPCGVVDLDNTATTRALVRRLDAFQTTRVTAHYGSVAEARQAIQRGDIYAFLYIPRGTTADLLSSRQPAISFYYSNVTMVAGSMLYRDLKTVSSLGAAAVGSAKLSAIGKTETEIRNFLQPIVIDLHMTNNPWSSYNIYLTTVMVPGVLMLFMLLITPYSIGTELKFHRAHDWMAMAGGHPAIAVVGKLLPQCLVFLTVMLTYVWYLYGHLGFPHPGGLTPLLLLALLTVTSAQGFGIFMFALMPSLRLSMSVCSLWGVIGFSISGSTFPVTAMHPMLEALSWLFPLRHYYMVSQMCVFNGFPLADAWPHVTALVAFSLLPVLNIHRIRKAMLEYVYIP